MDDHRIAHGLSLELAQRATRVALESYQEQFREYDPQASWRTDSRATVRFTVAGRTLEGELRIDEHHVHLNLEVPLIFRPFRSAALKLIDEEIRTWIAKARLGQLPSGSEEA